MICRECKMVTRTEDCEHCARNKKKEEQVRVLWKNLKKLKKLRKSINPL